MTTYVLDIRYELININSCNGDVVSGRMHSERANVYHLLTTRGQSWISTSSTQD